MSNPYADWARRQGGRKVSPGPSPSPAPKATPARAPEAPQAPREEPQIPPYAAPPVRAGSWAQQRPAAPHATIQRPETCTLVKPSQSYYDDWIATVPDVSGIAQGYDAMSGNVSPDSAQALREAGLGVESSPNPDAPPRSFHPNSMPSAKAGGLGK